MSSSGIDPSFFDLTALDFVDPHRHPLSPFVCSGNPKDLVTMRSDSLHTQDNVFPGHKQVRDTKFQIWKGGAHYRHLLLDPFGTAWQPIDPSSMIDILRR